MNFTQPLGFGKSGKTKRKSIRKVRHLLFEPLEERQMLSISSGEFDAIMAAYPDLDLQEMSHYNFIEIMTDKLSEAELRNAILGAGETQENDLIVLRTTTEQNTIILNGMELNININADEFGSITIVSLGDEKLLSLAHRFRT